MTILELNLLQKKWNRLYRKFKGVRNKKLHKMFIYES